jgi:hypothetical protein
MGTRHLTSVIHKEETKVAQYGQWDGYPSGQGLTILEFLRNKDNVQALKDKLRFVRFANEQDGKEWGAYYKALGSKGTGWVSMDISRKFHQRYPLLSRDVGADILEAITKLDEEVALQDSSQFKEDGLFCEWAYTIDLDKNKFIVENGAHAECDIDNLPTDEEFLSLEDREDED